MSEQWKAIGVLTSIFIAGVSFGISAYGWASLPAKLDHIQVQTDSLNSRADNLERNQEAIKVELKHLSSLIQQQLCLQVAEKRHTPWQNCLQE